MIRKLFFSVIASLLFFEGVTQCNTGFSKGLDFDGSTSDYSKNNNTSNDLGILRRNISLINSDRKAQPWAVGAILKWDGSGTSATSTIWSQANPSGSSSLYIKASIESDGKLAFRYGDNSNKIIQQTSSSFISAGTWYGLYIDYNGYVANGNSDDFTSQYSSIRIRLVNLSTGAVTTPSVVNSNSGTGFTGSVQNRIQIGVRNQGADEFDGQIASVVATTLAIDQNVSDAEIRSIISKKKN